MARTSTLVVLVDIVLFFIPEPITSGLPVLVILAGVAMCLLAGS